MALLSKSLGSGSDCLDIGANEGSVLREMVRLAPEGRHVAWEPLPQLADRLRAEFPSVEIRQAALSDRAGETEFVHVLEAPGWSGFLERPTPGSGEVERINVRCERLDDALAEGIRPALIKIDVEGAELQVLEGATGILRRHRPLIVFEHGRGSAEYYGTTPERIHDLHSEQLRYRVYGLDEDGPYDRERFVAIFARGEQVNFLARPGST